MNTEQSGSENKEDNITYLPKEEIKTYYGYTKFSENEKSAYSAIYNAIENHASEVNIREHGISKDSLTKIMTYLISDYAELIGLEKKYSYVYSSDIIISVSLEYIYTKSERESKLSKAESAAAPIIDSLKTKSTYDKIKGAHDWIIENTQYDSYAAALGSSNSDAYNIYGVFVNKKAVCEGYSKAFQYMMYKLGVPCLIVYGKNGGVNHSWNLVSVDGVYYHIDVTQDDPISSSEPILLYSYYLLNDSEIAVTHTISTDGSNYPLPSASSSAMNYFVKEGRYLTLFNRDRVTEIISNDAKSRNTFSHIRFTNKEELAKATEKLGNIISQVKHDTGISSLRYFIIKSDSSPVYTLTLRLKY